MGGAELYWKVTLLAWEGRDGRYLLQEYVAPYGSKKPDVIPWKIRGDGLSFRGVLHKMNYADFVDASNLIAEMSLGNPLAEFHYSRLFSP